MEASDQEVKSCAEAYSAAPWGEVQDLESVKKYLSKIRNNPNCFVIDLKDTSDDLPYLYIHGINYGKDIQGLIDEEFTGEHALWRTNDKDRYKIQDFLGSLDSAVYISNIHADKSAPVDSDKKPRLKVLDDVLADLFDRYNSDAIVLMTHYKTGVSKALKNIDRNKFTLESIDYEATCDTRFNDNHQIDYLTAYIIRRTKGPIPTT